MKSCAASVDNVPRLDCKRRHKQHILCIGALNVRGKANPRDVEDRKGMAAASQRLRKQQRQRESEEFAQRVAQLAQL